MTKKEKMQYPTHWKVVLLGDFVHTEKGKKPKRLCEKKSGTCAIPYIDIKAFEKGIVDKYTDGENCRMCYEEDILIVWDGSRSGLVGKGKNGALGSTLARLNFAGIDNDYAYYFMKSKYLEINSRAKGAATPHVDPELLWNYEFPLPPLEEQRRIVDKIEALFSELESSIESLKRAKEKLKHYRQSVLKSAFEGRLTAAWRETHKEELEDAEVLLEHIKKEREAAYEKRVQEWQEALKTWEAGGKEGKRPARPKKPKELPELSDEELENLPELPEGWGWSLLNRVSEISGGLTKNSKREVLPKKVPFLRVANVYENRLQLRDVHYIGINNDEIARVLLKKGDILFVEGNGSIEQIGRVAIWDGSIDECVHQNHLIKSRPSTRIASKYILYFFMSSIGRVLIKEKANSTSGLFTLNLTKINNLPLPICSEKEQHQIVNKIKTHFSEADAMEKAIDESLQKAERLRQSILKQAFEGRLVDSD